MRPINIAENTFFLLTLLFFFSISSAFAQEISVMVPQQLEDQANRTKLASEETFLNYPYEGETVDLTNFKRRYPKLDLPDSVRITLPKMPNIQDTSLLIGYLRNGIRNFGRLVILVAGNYNTNDVTFFADTNFDRDYRNDEPPFVVIGGTKPTTVYFYPPREERLTLTIGLPKRVNLIDQKLRELDVANKKFKRKIRKGFSIGGGLGIGTGNFDYEYQDLTRNYPTWYNVRFVERSGHLSFNYDLPFLRIGINSTFANMFYYTAYFNERVSEPRGIRTGVATERNIDQHALNKMELGVTLTAKLGVGKFSSFNPFVTYGQTTYFEDEYFADKRPGKERPYTYTKNNFLEYGLQFEFAVGNQRALYMNLSYNQLEWQPDDFLADIPFENLEIEHQSLRIVLGYKMALKRR